jgi:hypothetical protein
MKLKMKNELNREFGEVISMTCSFCGRTYDLDKFYSIPQGDPDTMLMKAAMKANSMFKRANKQKEVNEGICLKCIIEGILKICRNDKETAFDYINKIYNSKIVDSL